VALVIGVAVIIGDTTETKEDVRGRKQVHREEREYTGGRGDTPGLKRLSG